MSGVVLELSLLPVAVLALCFDRRFTCLAGLRYALVRVVTIYTLQHGVFALRQLFVLLVE